IVAELDLVGEFVALEHGEIDDPTEVEPPLVDEPQLLAELAAHGTGEFLRRGFLVADEEQAVAVFDSRGCGETLDALPLEVLGNGALAPALGEDDIAEPGSTLLPRPVVQLVEEAARADRGLGCRNGAHDGAGSDCLGENTEAGIPEDLGN